jgi:hypothetical protein
MLFAKICSRASRSACPLDVNPPDLFWISVASRAMVKVSSTYFSHLYLFSANSTQGEREREREREREGERERERESEKKRERRRVREREKI